jgi:hypothetical protein
VTRGQEDWWADFPMREEAEVARAWATSSPRSAGPAPAALDRDEFAPAHITFGADRRRQLELVAIQADIDYRVGTRDGKPAVEFSWQGSDEQACAPSGARSTTSTNRGS